MKVLLSAYACEPNRGSEPGVGWNVARELASRVELTVVTRRNNKMAIEQSGEDWINNVDWIYWDPPNWLTFWKKGAKGVQLFYMIWQLGVARAIRTRSDIKKFDILHHITFGKFWVPSSLANEGVPFIFGPVGGGEKTPDELLISRSMRARLSEFTKSILIKALTKLPPAKNFFMNVDWIFAATEQTLFELKSMNVGHVSLLPQSGIQIEDFAPYTSQARSKQNVIKLITASRLIHWKAVDLAIEAIALASKSIDVTLIVLQEGEELKRLKKLASKLGITDRVIFKGKLSKLSEVHELIGSSDALLHPALHEAFGQVCLESLALGTPVICLDWAGPGMIVNRDTGIAVKPSDRRTTIHLLSEAIIQIYNEKTNGIYRHENCIKRAQSVFAWEIITNTIIDKYNEIIYSINSSNNTLL